MRVVLSIYESRRKLEPMAGRRAWARTLGAQPGVGAPPTGTELPAAAGAQRRPMRVRR